MFHRSTAFRVAAVAAIALAPALRLAGVAAAGDVAGRAPTTYEIDADESTLTIDVERAGLISSLGHNHSVVAKGLAGRIDLDPANPAAGRVAFEVAASAFRIADAGIDDDRREKIQKNMEENVLEPARFPKIAFRSTAVAPVAGRAGSFVVTGDLTLHGVTRAVKVDVTLEARPDALAAAGSARVKQSDFGIEPYSAALGAVAVADEIGVSFAVHARAAGATSVPAGSQK